jgi:hypothetical protein
MKIDFFEKELIAVRQRYNQTFGKQTVCNIKTRYHVILRIIRMEWLHRKIKNDACTKDAKGEIQMFVKTKNALNTIFNEAEKCWGGRRHYENTRKRSNQRGNVG